MCLSFPTKNNNDGSLRFGWPLYWMVSLFVGRGHSCQSRVSLACVASVPVHSRASKRFSSNWPRESWGKRLRDHAAFLQPLAPTFPRPICGKSFRSFSVEQERLLRRLGCLKPVHVLRLIWLSLGRKEQFSRESTVNSTLFTTDIFSHM